GYPHPIAGLGLILFVELAAYRIGCRRTNDPYGNLHLRPGNQVGQVPPLAISRAKGSLNWWHGLEQPGGILIEIPTFILEDYQRVFAVRQQEVEEGGLGVERVGQHQIEGTWITDQHALPQTRGGGG